MEFYFGEWHWSHNKHIRDSADEDDWVSLYELLMWPRMKELNVALPDFKEALKGSFVCELNEKGDKVRKKEKELSEKIKVLGVTQEGIDQMTVQQYNEFKKQ